MEKKRRGRPKGTGRVNRQGIIDAALDALAQGGYLGLTMRGVARTLEVSLTSVQNHFPTKDDLWRACIDHLIDVARPSFESDDGPSLSAVIERALRRGGSRPGLLAAVMTDNAPGSEERIAYVAEQMADVLAVGRQRLTDLESAGLIRAVDHQAFQALIFLGIRSIGASRNALDAIFGYDLSSDSDRAALADALADILGRGLAPQGPR